ncbi:MAG: hypothetical protein RL220_288 [Bacteroidota bacterium]
MSRRTIFFVILLAFISLSGIVVGQVIWARNAHSFEERQFNFRVMVAMTNVVKRILAINNDEAVTEPVKQVSSNYFVANINDTPQPYLLESLLREEFEKSHLTDDFEYGIYDCFNDSIVFGSRVEFDEPLGEVKHEKVNIDQPLSMDGHYFGVLFPNKSAVILKKLDFLKYSSLIIVVIIIFFTYSLWIILRQRKLSEIKTDFINNMTHELKTPISTISLSADVLSSANTLNDPERLKQYANIIRNESERLKSQVEKVLQLSTLSVKKVNMKRERVDLHEVIRKAAETLHVPVAEAGGEIRTDLKADFHFIRGDMVHITNVIYNLLDNAVKYTEDAPVIRIETENTGKKIELRVIDNGIGMKPSQVKMIFDKFYRVPTGDLHNVKGFGLGLFYVKTVVKAHGGKIRVKSEPGKGSTFTIEMATV